MDPIYKPREEKRKEREENNWHPVMDDTDRHHRGTSRRSTYTAYSFFSLQLGSRMQQRAYIDHTQAGRDGGGRGSRLARRRSAWWAPCRRPS
uniref:Uncharacterized protein n=1 Tax=Zea mays TaxID=4577 RepID=C0PMX9_MAIZE|nr:unknown [Zea mays]